MRFQPQNKATNTGFTLVEMVVIAPVVILAIGAFIAAIVAMTGDVLSSRGSNMLTYNVQDALNRIEEDVKLSSGFLASNSIAFSASNPQGYGSVGSTTNFSNVGGGSGTSLILSTIATNGNPLATTSRMVYLADQPNSCATYAEYSKNRPMVANIIYFVDSQGTLWRRTVMPSDYDNAALRCGTAAWQQPSCQAGYVSAFCKTNDVKLLSGVGPTGFSINYFPSADSTAPSTAAVDPSTDPFTVSARVAALKAMQTVGVTISASDTIAGRSISRDGTMRVTRLDTNATAIADAPAPTVAPAAPVVANTVTEGSKVTFTWPRVATASSYAVEYKINAGAWVSVGAPRNNDQRSYSVLANHEDTVSVQIKSTNSAGSSAYGGSSVKIPFWAPLVLANGWVAYGAPYTPPEFSRTASGLVIFKGLIKNTGGTGNGLIASLPVGYRPTARLMMPIATASGMARLDTRTNGDILYSYGGTAWYSLDNIHYMADSTGLSNVPSYTRTNLTLSSSWTNVGTYGGDAYAPASYVVDNRGRVVVQAVIEPGTITNGTLIAAIPAALRPARHQIVPAVSNSFSALSSNATTGIAARGLGGGSHGLSTFWFPATPSPAVTWTNLTLLGNWTSFDGGTTYETNQYTKTSDGMVSLKGIIKGTSGSGVTIATLPAGYRPEGRMIFIVTSSDGYSRIDIAVDGNIVTVNGPSSNAWQSLDGITFRADN